jgi:hypothetical protein
MTWFLIQAPGGNELESGDRAGIVPEVHRARQSVRLTSDGLSDAPARNGAEFCVAADADAELIPQWIEGGRRRAGSARQPPFSGGMHGP